jgi:hypothetical protein
MQEGKNWILRSRQTGSSETLIGWNSGKNHLCPSMGPTGGSVAMDSGYSIQWCQWCRTHRVHIFTRDETWLACLPTQRTLQLYW